MRLTPKMWKVVALREVAVGVCHGDTPELIARYYRESVVTDDRWVGSVESMVVVMLNTRRRIMGHSLVATGTLDAVMCHAREVFRAAIVANASAIVLMHNHPSGDPGPSEADIKITRELIRGGQLLKIEVLDHIIMGELAGDRTRDYSSLRELGYFYS